MTDVASLQIKIDSTSAKEAEKSLNGLEKQSGKTERSAASMIRQFIGAAAVLGTTFAVIKKSVKAATEYQAALTGLASIARYAGEDIQATLGTATELTADGMLSVGEAATAMKNLLAKGFSTDQAVEMINRLKDAAAFGKQGSLEFGQAVLSATEGIKNENSILVDNAGVTKNISVMQEEYARSIGKTVNQLSEAEKRQAVYSGILRETEGQIGNAALASQGMEGSTARMSKAINDAAISIGQSFTPAAMALTNLLTEGLQGGMDNVVKPFLYLFESLGVEVGHFAMNVGAVFELIGSPSKWLNPQKAASELAEQFKIYEDIAEQSKMDIAARLSGISSPVIIGKDTGARRKDIVNISKEELELKKKIAEENAKEYAHAEAMARITDIEIYGNVQLTESQKKIVELLTQQEQGVLKLSDAELARQSSNLATQASSELAMKAFIEQQKEAEKAAKDAAKESQKHWETFADNTQRTMSEVFFNGMTGKYSDIEQMFGDMLKRMLANAAAAKLSEAMFGASGTKGGGWIGAIAGLFSADGGGFTGSGTRSGGVDGKGGFPAILHPNETVIDHTKGQSAGGNITIVDQTTINVDARSDRNQVMNDVSKLIEGKQAQLVDRLQRQGALA